ncbi:hypothetical protein EA187_07725 [Lujinxingia sediminis]|uniref:Chromosome condensation regulator RCC1 n=1 Tax=Lujinxingia sediminis TaxID=2480984 RepID=A0ABY0CVB2_9DELT|nr:hypothetical protein [Lujinxingia sediminis]RVU47011.1 hypothetical protein EA187_07725 [Lujinxingia sediminis]
MRRSLAWGGVRRGWALLGLVLGLAGCVLMVDGEAALELGADGGAEPGAFRAMILDGPEIAAAGGSAYFELGCEPQGCELQCARDGGAFETCGSTYMWDALEEGDHVLAARAWKGDEVSEEVWWSFEVGPPIGLEVEGDLSASRFFREVGELTIACDAPGCELSCGMWALEEGCELSSCGTALGWGCEQPGTVAVEVPGPGRYLVQVEGCDPESGACERYASHFEVEAPRWHQVSAGGRHTCGILETGALLCWGDNTSGQLGVTQAGATWSARRVEGRWARVAAGEAHTCAVDIEGKLYCWGANEANQASPQMAGELGVTRVGQRSDWEEVAAGAQHSCGWRAGKLYCWGSGEFGQIGPASAIAGGVVVEIETVEGSWVADGAVGSHHSCAVAAGDVWCFGDRRFGAVGYGEGEGEPGEVRKVGGAKSVTRLVAGEHYSCGVSAAGDVRCWGAVPGEEQVPSLEARTLTGISQVTMLSGGYGHVCAIDMQKVLRCWGSNDRQQVSGHIDENIAPVTRIAAGWEWETVSAGAAHSCAIEDGTRYLFCWGSAEHGRLGTQPTVGNVGSPREVTWVL